MARLTKADPAYVVGRRPPRRFRRRVFFYLLTLSLATSTISGATYYSRQVKFVEKERARRSRTLLTNLATQAELGAYAGDASLCELPARRTFNEEDVVLVALYDARGRELLRMAAPSIWAPPRPPIEVRPLLRNPDAAPLKLHQEGYEDLWAPIVTTSRAAAVALSSEPGGPPARREVVGLARIGLSLRPAEEQLREVLQAGVYLTVGLLALGALAALLIAGRISDPILALARGADEIRSGNLNVTIQISSHDEIGLLAESFNRMAAKLRQTMAELEALNRNLEGEVLRRTDEIRRSAEFTEALNAPLEPARPQAEGDEHPELGRLLSDALDSLVAATNVRAAAVLLPREEALEFELRVAASRSRQTSRDLTEPPASFGEMPSYAELRAGGAQVSAGRAVIPLLLRGEPEGAVVLLDDPVPKTAVEFAARAAGPLAIAISNARAYAALEHLAKELTERNAALVRQRDQLREMNRLKSEFLANISHELRTPLNAIVGYTELIAERVYGPTTTQQQEGLAGIDESSHNLLTLINQILDLSKVESGKMEIYLTEVAMHDVVQAVVAETQALARERSYHVQVVSPLRVVVQTDRVRVQQILTNLVSNAIKFTPQGEVVVTVAPTPDGGATVAVRDTGIGIRKEDQQIIFEEFRQVDGSSTRKYAGTGLGLAIARRFAALLSGTITVESELGKGSTFTLHLPRQPRPFPRPPPAPIGVTGEDARRGAAGRSS